MKKNFFYTALGLMGMILPLSTQAYEDGIYTGLVDENGSGVITVKFSGNGVYSGVEMTLKVEDQPGTYIRGFGGGSLDTLDNGYTPNPTPENMIQRKGPCDTGYHVPSRGERNALIVARCSIDENCTYYDAINNPSGDLKKSSDGVSSNIDKIGSGTPFRNTFNMTRNYYWSSSPVPDDYYKAFHLSVTENTVTAGGRYSKSSSYPVRCLKNSIVEPAPSAFTITFVGSGQGSISTGSIEAEEGTSISRSDEAGTVTISGTVVATGIANEGYVFSGWLTDCGATVTTTCNFTGEFKPITYTISFSGNAADATGTAPATINAQYSGVYTAPDNSFTRTGYTFTGWNTQADGSGTGYATGAELKNLTTTSGDDVMLYAQWEVNVHKLNFVVDGTNIQSGDVAYSSGISAFLPSEPKKDCNSFAGWTSNVEGLTTTGTMPDSDVTFTANWNYTCSRSSGGGGSSRSSSSTANTQDSSTSSQNDDKTQNSSTKATDSEDNTQDSSAEDTEGQNQGKTYSDEFQQAYEFAYKHGITTMPTIEQANMEGPLTRIAMAKMLSYYAINVLGLKPDETRVNKFKDVSDKMDAEYNNAVSLAYQLGIMGINMPNNKFRPNDLVTRAEFATALSRMLYKIADGKDKYYSTHLAKLMEEEIITNNNPDLQELRGYVMIMLMRSAK